MKISFWVGAFAGMAALAMFAQIPANAQYTVPGTSDPWLAGMPAGSTASFGDVAPDQSPVLASGLTLVPGSALTFSVTGSVNNIPAPSGLPPDGGGFTGHATGAENGIAYAVIPINSLVGVFLDNNQPDTTAAPGPLDFSTLGTSFPSLSPGLKQPFFIGDGLTGNGTGSVQQFIVPSGATRLFLGTMDGYGWYNNFGTFSVTVNGSSPVPEPGTYALLASLGLTGAALLLRRRVR